MNGELVDKDAEKWAMEYETKDNGTVRQFATGAIRDTSEGKYEPWGFTSALVTKRFCAYMHQNRTQSDGNLRDSDNWKLGITQKVYKDSLSRHIEDLKLILEGFADEATEPDIETVLCAVRFNVEGLLHEILKQHREENS